jgi:hypothetical protein
MGDTARKAPSPRALVGGQQAAVTTAAVPVMSVAEIAIGAIATSVAVTAATAGSAAAAVIATTTTEASHDGGAMTMVTAAAGGRGAALRGAAVAPSDRRATAEALEACDWSDGTHVRSIKDLGALTGPFEFKRASPIPCLYVRARGDEDWAFGGGRPPLTDNKRSSGQTKWNKPCADLSYMTHENYTQGALFRCTTAT